MKIHYATLLAALAAAPACVYAAQPSPPDAQEQLFKEWTKLCAKEAKASIGGVRAGIPGAAAMSDEKILRLTFDDYTTAKQSELAEAVELMKGEDLLPNEALFLCFAKLRLKK